MKIMKILFITVTIITGSVLYLIFAEHSIGEINAKNYRRILVQNKSENIFYSGTTSFVYNDFFLTDASKYVARTTPNRKLGWFEFGYYDNDGFVFIEVLDHISKVAYTINYENGVSYDYSVYENPIASHNPKIKEYLNEIMDKNDLIVSTSKERSFDILIQENKNDFIIYTVQGHLDAPFAIWVQRYYKTKYLHINFNF